MGAARAAKPQIVDIEKRMERLSVYEKWKPVEAIDFKALVGEELYGEYWGRLDRAMEYMKECQEFAEGLKKKIAGPPRASDERSGLNERNS